MHENQKTRRLRRSKARPAGDAPYDQIRTYWVSLVSVLHSAESNESRNSGMEISDLERALEELDALQKLVAARYWLLLDAPTEQIPPPAEGAS